MKIDLSPTRWISQRESQEDWDVVVVGTGMGGSVLGHELARAGLRVLFLEKGHSHLGTSQALRGNYPEVFLARAQAPRARLEEFLARGGRWWEPLEDASGRSPRFFVPLLGCGAGGSSALYGMALERFLPGDFTPRQHHPRAAESSLPEAWPIGYQTLEPYYGRIEKEYRVCGTPDPLRPGARDRTLRAPPPWHCANAELYRHFESRRLHPYRLPLACGFKYSDDNYQSFLDATGDKNDAARISLAPAIREHGAVLWDRCEALRIEADRRRVTRVICRREGNLCEINARQVVLAAGALATPCLLLNSASPHWPRGLANRSGLVGRNLMRHFIDLYAVRPQVPGPYEGHLKQLACNDFYLRDKEKLGTIQSFGRLPPPSMILDEMRQELAASARWKERIFKCIQPAAHALVKGMLSRSLLLCTILEDLPYLDNRVEPIEGVPRIGGPAMRFQYRMGTGEARRIEAFRRQMAEVLRPYRFHTLRQADNNKRLAHACGTCRFGDDPRTSVLDASNRAHEIDNLYVADASFFPSSGGTNPGLTIAANALRVAEHLLDRLGRPRARTGDAKPECAVHPEPIQVRS